MRCNKSFFFIFFFCIVCYVFPSKNSFFISPVFLHHTIHTKVIRDESKADDVYRLLIPSVSDDIYRDVSSCFGMSFDLNFDIVYLSLRCGFPTQMQSQFLNFPVDLLKNKSIISDFEIGLCYKTFEKKPYDLLFCLGLGLGVVHANMLGYMEKKGGISYTRTDFMLGLGGNILFTYNFHKVVGIYFGFGDMLYFMNIKTYKLLECSDSKFVFEEKLKSENFNAINTFANSLSIRTGFVFAF